MEFHFSFLLLISIPLLSLLSTSLRLVSVYLYQFIYISFNSAFPSRFLFLPIVPFIQSYLFFYPHTCSFNQIIRFCHVFVFEILNFIINLIYLNLQCLFVYFLKRNVITCFSFQHYFIYLFNNLSILIIQIMPYQHCL